jgi:hypothetical protein
MPCTGYATTTIPRCQIGFSTFPVESLPVIDFMRDLRKLGKAWKILILPPRSNCHRAPCLHGTSDIAARSNALAV